MKSLKIKINEFIKDPPALLAPASGGATTHVANVNNKLTLGQIPPFLLLEVPAVTRNEGVSDLSSMK